MFYFVGKAILPVTAALRENRAESLMLGSFLGLHRTGRSSPLLKVKGIKSFFWGGGGKQKTPHKSKQTMERSLLKGPKGGKATFELLKATGGSGKGNQEPWGLQVGTRRYTEPNGWRWTWDRDREGVKVLRLRLGQSANKRWDRYERGIWQETEVQSKSKLCRGGREERSLRPS